MELLELPNEILERIISKCDVRTLYICANVNHKFRTIAQIVHKKRFSQHKYIVFLLQNIESKQTFRSTNNYILVCAILDLLSFFRIFGQNIKSIEFHSNTNRPKSQLFFHQIGNYLNEYCINAERLSLMNLPLLFLPWIIPKKITDLCCYGVDLESIIHTVRFM